MEWSNVAIAFGLTLFAGMATAIGGAIAFFAKRTNTTFLSYSLGFSAGVMIYISFTELLGEAHIIISNSFTDAISSWLTFAYFIGGFGIAALIDKLIPSRENPHEVRSIEQMDVDCPKRGRKLLRMGTFTAIAIAIHNFPEGIATFMAGISDITVGVSIAIAIAIHNIPEGIAVSVPVYYATGSRRKAFLWAALSGLSEPIGAAFAYFFLSFLKIRLYLDMCLRLLQG